MLHIDIAHALLDEIAKEIPQEFWEGLNGGVSLVPQSKRSPDPQDIDLYILGEYHQGPPMGRFIILYYGSFRRVFGDLSQEELRAELRQTLLHEFTHHVEALAGAHALDDKDASRLADYHRARQKDN